MLPHEEWLYKARNDLASARVLFSAANPILDTAIYHAQQCGEKALKAYLSFKRKDIERTHDVRVLAELCARIDKDFQIIAADAIFLTPFATAFRYPDISSMEPEQDDVASAIQSAERIFEMSVKKTAGGKE